MSVLARAVGLKFKCLFEMTSLKKTLNPKFRLQICDKDVDLNSIFQRGKSRKI